MPIDSSEIAQSTCIWHTHGATIQAGNKEIVLDTVKALMVITIRYLVDTYLSLRTSSWTLGWVSGHVQLGRVASSLVAVTNATIAILIDSQSWTYLP